MYLAASGWHLQNEQLGYVIHEISLSCKTLKIYSTHLSFGCISERDWRKVSNTGGGCCCPLLSCDKGVLFAPSFRFVFGVGAGEVDLQFEGEVFSSSS